MTDLHPEDHTYGKPSLGNLHGVEDLLNESPPSLLRRDMQIFLTYMNSLRHRISEKISTGEIDLEEIFEEITNLNKGDKEEVNSIQDLSKNSVFSVSLIKVFLGTSSGVHS